MNVCDSIMESKECDDTKQNYWSYEEMHSKPQDLEIRLIKHGRNEKVHIWS